MNEAEDNFNPHGDFIDSVFVVESFIKTTRRNDYVFVGDYNDYGANITSRLL